VRTSSAPFSLKRNTNLLVHLTNDAVQKHAEEYGKYEKGNKVSYEKLHNYLNRTVEKEKRNCFYEQILPEMKELTLNAVKATYLSLDPNRKVHNFELLGMDFMIDDNLKPWLIEMNTNPCLELSSPLLSRIIPTVIEQAMRYLQ
jgi:D-alanine-D-alanine ligase-like ATP-grasp enzyme